MYRNHFDFLLEDPYDMGGKERVGGGWMEEKVLWLCERVGAEIQRRVL